MSTKPTIANARFADTGGADVVAPTSGLRDTGFVAGTFASQSLVNYLLNQLYQWAQFLDEVLKVAGTAVADLKLSGQATFGGALAVLAGGFAVTGNSNVNGTLAVSSNETVGGTLAVTGPATVGGTLGVTGLITASGGIAAFTATGLITANAGITAGANQHVTVSGTGDYKHGAQEVSVINFAAVGNSTFNTPSGGPGVPWSNWGGPPNDTISGGIEELRVGDRILSVTYFYSKGGSAAGLTMSVNTRNGTTNTPRDSLTDVTSGAGFVSITRSFTYTLVAGDAPYITVQAQNAAHRFSHATISYDHP